MLATITTTEVSTVRGEPQGQGWCSKAARPSDLFPCRLALAWPAEDGESTHEATPTASTAVPPAQVSYTSATIGGTGRTNGYTRKNRPTRTAA